MTNKTGQNKQLSDDLNRNFFKYLYESFHEPIFILDEKYIIQYSNKAVLDALRVSIVVGNYILLYSSR